MIVKNEARIIRRCLESARPLIDSALIVDTGSEDDTIAVVREAFADLGLPGRVVEEPWRDFAYNRSFALERLREVPARNQSVLLVGHNPGLHELAVRLAESHESGLLKRLSARFPTAAFAAYELAGDWAHLDGETARLVALVTPKELAGAAN